MNIKLISKRVLGIVFIGIFVFFIYQAFQKYIADAAAFSIVPSVPFMIIGFFAFFVWVSVYADAWFWILTKICRGEVEHSLGISIFLQGMLARYIPGKVWQFIVLVRELEKEGIERSVSILSVVYQQINLIGSTAVVGLFIAPLYITRFVSNSWIIVIVAACGLAFTIAWVFFPAYIFKLFIVFKINKFQEQWEMLRQKAYLAKWQASFVLFLLVVVLQGVVLLPIILGLTSQTFGFPEWLLLLLAYPISRLIGQLAFVFPGGLGVREGVYVLLVSPVIDPNMGAVIAVWARLLATCAELAVFANSWIIARLKARNIG